MTIYRYCNAANTSVERIDDGASVFIPWGVDGPAGGGEPWQQWAADGKPTPEPFVAPPPPPRSIHAAWFQLALDAAGKLTQVEAAVAGLSSAQQILWRKATEFNEADPDVRTVATALGIDLKALFDRAEAIRDARP